MKPYPKYKDSGIEWIGKVPEGWSVKKLKWLANIRLSNIDKKSKEGELAVELCNYVDVYYNDNITSDIEFMKATARQDQIDIFSLKEGDILITKDSETPDDIAVPAFVSSSLHGVVCGYHLAHVRPYRKYADGNYLFWSFSAHGISNQFEISANGVTRFGIGKQAIDNSVFLTPPLDEQTAIAAYLDRKTTQIDDLISKKQKLIELLKEEHAAIINQAVTKGLNPDAPMKDSGIEWLGEVPEHWKIKKIKYLLKNKKGALKTGPFGSQLKNSDLSSEGFKVYNQRSVLDKDFDSGDSFISNEKFLELRDFEVFPGDLLLTSRGTIGKCAIFPSKKIRGILHPCLIRIQFDHDLIINDYAELFIQNSHLFAESIAFNSNATTIDVIYGDTLRDVDLVFSPNIKEQNGIVMFVKKQTTKIDQTISNIEKQIELLQEYRTALISEVVTGKIDVRDGGSNE